MNSTLIQLKIQIEMAMGTGIIHLVQKVTNFPMTPLDGRTLIKTELQTRMMHSPMKSLNTQI